MTIIEIAAMTSDLGDEETLIWGLTIDSGSFSAQAIVSSDLHSSSDAQRARGCDATAYHYSLRVSAGPAQLNQKYGAQANLYRCICWGRDLHRVCHSREAREVASGGSQERLSGLGLMRLSPTLGLQRCVAVQMQRDGRRDMQVTGGKWQLWLACDE